MQRQYVLTERAHFMCPNMHFGMLVELEEAYDKEKTMLTLHKLANAHPFLKSLISYDADGIRLFYDIQEHSMIEFSEKEDINTLWDDYKELGKKEWNPFDNGLLKVYAYKNAEHMTILFTAHHLLGDGRCVLEIAKEFTDYYVQGIEPQYVEENLIHDISDLPPKSELNGISKMLIKQANKKWKKEQKQLDYPTYAQLSEKYVHSKNVTHSPRRISDQEYQNIRNICKDNQISVNDWLMADMYLKTGTNKIIIAVDIRDRIAYYHKGAYGNYASAMGIVCKTKTRNQIQKAKEVHELVKKTIADNRKLMLVLSCYLVIDPTLLDAAAMSGISYFDSNAGRFVGGQMFGYANPESYSITNLGKTECQGMRSAMFIPPASPAAKMTMGVVTVNNHMSLCSSSYEEN